MRFFPAAALAALIAVAGHAATPSSVGDAVAGDWRAIPDDELLVMTLAGGRRVAIRLAPRLAPEHVANLRALAHVRWWDGTSVYRVQDNWVAQWGGQPADRADDPANKPLPPDLRRVPAAEYDAPAGLRIAQPVGADAYAGVTGITADGWAVAGPGIGIGAGGGPAWPVHCYGTVAVARDASPDTGSGSELFMPLGGSARRLDRNYALVGRVIEGAEFLSGLPRSSAPMGVYATAAERTGIVSVRLASDIPAEQRPRYAYRAADNPRFAAMVAARRHRAGMVSSGGIDVCDVPLAVRRVEPNGQSPGP